MKNTLIVLVILFTMISTSAQEITTVKSSIIELTDKEYGINELKLLIYPNIEQIAENASMKTTSEKCKIWYKIKINKKTESVQINLVASDCEFDERLNFENHLKSQTHFYIIEANLKDNLTELTIPVVVVKSQ